MFNIIIIIIINDIYILIYNARHDATVKWCRRCVEILLHWTLISDYTYFILPFSLLLSSETVQSISFMYLILMV